MVRSLWGRKHRKFSERYDVMLVGVERNYRKFDVGMMWWDKTDELYKFFSDIEYG